MTPKQRFFAYTEAHGIEIAHEVSSRGAHHLTASAPEGMWFSGYRCELIALWDGERGNPPDWAFCLRDLQNMMPLEPIDGEAA
jgi:hypothetical protein